MTTETNDQVERLDVDIQSSKAAPFAMTVADGKLFTRSLGDTAWTPVALTVEPDAQAPALCLLDSSPFLAYREKGGGGSDRSIYTGKRTGTTWSITAAAPTARTDDPVGENPLAIATDHPPAVVDLGGSVYMAFKRNTKHILGIAKSEAGKPWTTSKIKNVGGAVDHKGIETGDDWLITNRAPALTDTVIDALECLFLVFGGHGLSSLWFGYSPLPLTEDGWSCAKIPNVKSDNVSPGVTSCGDKVVVAFINTDAGDEIYTTVYSTEDNTWAAPVRFLDHQNKAVAGKKQVNLACDGTFIYLSCVTGNSTRLYKIAKAAIVGA